MSFRLQHWKPFSQWTDVLKYAVSCFPSTKNIDVVIGTFVLLNVISLMNFLSTSPDIYGNLVIVSIKPQLSYS